MTSAPVPREPADPPSVNVLRSSLALFSLYIATTVTVSLVLSPAAVALLGELAAERGESRSAVVEGAIVAYAEGRRSGD